MKLAILSLFLLSALLLVTPPQTVSAANLHQKLFKECKDHSHFNCHLVALNNDCEKHSQSGEVIGDEFCQVSCGRCSAEWDAVMPDQTCYSFGKQEITVQYTNRQPEVEDWIGIYPLDADSTDLGTPIAWYWLCGNKRDKCKTGVGSVTFPWLPPGVYKAALSRNHDAKGPYANYGPYWSYAESEMFEIVRGNSCSARRKVMEEVIIIGDSQYKIDNTKMLRRTIRNGAGDN